MLRLPVDRLRADDLERARSTPPGEKADQALDAMRLGIELKWSALRARHPSATDEDVDRMLLEWLRRDD